MGSRYYAKVFRARQDYICDACGKTIRRDVPYFRHEPHPRARFRGATTEKLCSVCATGYPSWEISSWPRAVPLRLEIPFIQALQELPGMLLQAAVVHLGEKTEEGHVIQAVALPWLKIIDQISKKRDFLFHVPWRKLEELIAGAYEKEPWDEVILTPPSNDGGRDIIAVKKGICRIRIIDQVKAFAPGNCVTANDVRALLGVLAADPKVSKGFVTTTAEFAPRIRNDRSINQFIPYRLKLRDGQDLRNWLLQIAGKKSCTCQS